MQRINFNGREYASADDMPPHVRRDYERLLAQLPDEDRNGVPDLMDRIARGEHGITPPVSITINGRSYDDPDQLPAEERRIYDAAMARAGASGSAIERVSSASTLKGELTWTADGARLAPNAVVGRVVRPLLWILLPIALAALYLLARG